MLTLNDINIRDPFVLVDDKYYLYGSRASELWGKCTGLDVYTSTDLISWTEAVEVFHKPDDFWSDMNFWAPEIHKYNNKYYMFASFKSESRCRGTQILISDSPMGPFKVHSDGPLTPIDWECLDGTLYIDKNNVPYMVFCHEWVQVRDGQICAMRLSEDLSKAVEAPFVLFTASQPEWAVKGADFFVTDGPFMYKTKNNRLIMIWSSLVGSEYVEAISYSDNGYIDGGWCHKKELLFDNDGGHGMIFTGKDNNLYFIFHTPNNTPNERPKIIGLYEKDDMLFLKNSQQ